MKGDGRHYIIASAEIKFAVCRIVIKCHTFEEEEMATIEDFKKLEFRIGEIISAETHPQADRLLVLRVRIADSERTLVAGIRKHYTESELVGKKIVVVANLDPAQIRGVTSEGMALAASDENSLSLVVPERQIASGAPVR